MPALRRHPLTGFKYAQEGILHCFRTQPNMRFHFMMLVFVLIAGLTLELHVYELLSLTFASTLVIVMEMMNTAIEKLVDLVAENYNPVAKLIKDVAAAAVLLAALNAVFAGVLVFVLATKLGTVRDYMTTSLTTEVARVVIIGLVLLTLIVLISKLLSKTGTPWHGGIVSGHSAIGFLLAMTIFFTTKNTLIAFLAILLAILVAQSRVEAGVHSIREVILGAMLAIVLTAVVYKVMPHKKSAPEPQPASHTFNLRKRPVQVASDNFNSSGFEGVFSFG